MRITRVKLAGRLTFLTVLTTGGLTAGGLTVGTMTALHAQQWPSFRGAGSSGVAATGTPPVAWDLAGSKNVLDSRIPVPWCGAIACS
jgi:hypothetical protein